MKKIITTAAAPAAIGPYSQAVGTDAYLFISGQLPIDPAVGGITSTTIEEQTEQVMQNIGALLEASDLTFADVIKTTCFLADLCDFAAFNAVYMKYFPTNAPARSCFAVAGLPQGAKLEIEAICVQ